MQTSEKQIAAVRAIPATGHKRRWCGMAVWIDDPKKRPGPKGQRHALPWPESEVKVAVVDDPAPFDPDANGGVPTEISPATFAELEQDPRIAVRIVAGADGGNPDELVQAKVTASKLEQERDEARRDLASALEEMKHYRLSSEQQAKELAAKVVQLEAKLHEQAAVIASHGSKKR